MLRKILEIYTTKYELIIHCDGNRADSFLFFILNMYWFYNKEEKNKCPFLQVHDLTKKVLSI